MPRIAYRLDEAQITWDAVRSQGAGGQNVNKVSSAAVLAFDIPASSLPDALKARLLGRADQRINQAGVLQIKAQEHRSLPQNKAAALARLRALLDDAAHLPETRRPTRPTRASRERRLQGKARHAATKAGRGRVPEA
jgi:ribosome-associated protein